MANKLQSWSIAECLKKLQEYENLEEDGRLVVLPKNPDWKLFEKNYGNGRREYLYGPSWKSMELLMEGGYPTPEEAKEAWLRECGGK